jgi:hypothetical protein
MGICAALCNAPARRPSLCASGLSLLPATRTVCENGKIATSALGIPPGGDASADPAHALKAAILDRARDTADVWFDGAGSTILLEILRDAGIKTRAWIMARSGVDVSEIAAQAQRLGAEFSIVPLIEEELPPLAQAAIEAGETLIADSSAVAHYAFFKAARVPRMLSAVGAAELFSTDGLARRDGIPEFVARLQPECELAHFLLKPEWARRVKRHDWRAEFAEKDELAAREFLLRTQFAHHKLPEQVLTAAACGVELRMPFLDRAMVALRGAADFQLNREQSPTAGIAPALSARARRDWILWLDTRLSFDRLERLEVIDAGRVRRELIQYGKLHTEAPRRVLLERVFFKLASLTVLQEYWS